MIVPWARPTKYSEHRTLDWEMDLDGTLKVSGFEPLPAEPDQSQLADLAAPALQICGFKDGVLSEPTYYHKWQISSMVAYLC